MYRILLVDDEENVLHALKRLLRRVPCRLETRAYPLEVETCGNPASALTRAGERSFDLVIADYRMPGMDGVTFLKRWMDLQPGTARMILSGYADLNAVIAAINEARIHRFLSKPWNDYELVTAVAQALAFRDLQLENERLADELRVMRGRMTPQELEMKRLEAEEPGITKVHWGADGSVILDDYDIVARDGE